MKTAESLSLSRIRMRKFRRIKRGYYSFLILSAAYLATFFLPFLMNNRAIALQHEGAWYFPAFRSYFHDAFGVGSSNIVKAEAVGQTAAGGRDIAADAEILYRDLKMQFEEEVALIENLGPIAKKKLLGHTLTAEESDELAEQEALARQERAEKYYQLLTTLRSKTFAKHASGRRLSPSDRVRFKKEMEALSTVDRHSVEQEHEIVRGLAKNYPLARRAAGGAKLTDNQKEQLRAALQDETTPLEQAIALGLTEESLDNFVIMPLFDHSPYEKVEGFARAPALPEWPHIMGTDSGGRDIFVRMAYAFRLSITLALIVVFVAYTYGTLLGALLGYYGRWVDMLGLRFVEIWGAIPFLYAVMILGQLFGKNFFMLCGILASFGWLGITYLIRGEFYREKSRDYVAAAIATGEGNLAIIWKHILPNALTPIITYAPFAMVATISSLVALDYLGFGLPASEPSWGQLLRQAKDEGLGDWHLIVFPLSAMFITLQLIVFIGEAVREAFDPKVFSRLR